MTSLLKFPLLIDGGLSNVLEAGGYDLNHHLWTAKLLDENPEAIVNAHLAYLKAGAQCITTASYQASVPGFMAIGYTQEQAENLILKSVQLAEAAIKKAHQQALLVAKPIIAASIGPYGAYLADGSEYRGNYGITDQVLQEFHQDRLHLLSNSNADCLACETIPSFQEIKVLSKLLERIEKPAWVSFSCKDEGHLNDGSPLQRAAALFAKHPSVFAVGVNCTHPKYISKIIKTLKDCIGDKKVIIYPNSGEAYHAGTKSWMGLSDPEQYVTMAKEWLGLGADLIGGCCRIGTEHIIKICSIL